MYPAGHPYAHSVIGTHEDLKAASVADVVEFFDTWYSPSNASLVVAGDFDPLMVRPQIERMFGSISPSETPPRATPLPIIKPQKEVLELVDQVQYPQTTLLWHSPTVFQSGDADCDIIASILASGRSSRLYKTLVHDLKIAQDVSAYQMSAQLGSMFMIQAMPTDGHTMEELEIATEGPSADELERVKNQIELTFVESLEDLGGRATSLNRYQTIVGDSNHIQSDLDRYRNATAASIAKWAKTLSVENRAIIRVTPEAEVK